eukprot:497761-Amphidinium_carterae.1
MHHLHVTNSPRIILECNEWPVQAPGKKKGKNKEGANWMHGKMDDLPLQRCRESGWDIKF